MSHIICHEEANIHVVWFLLGTFANKLYRRVARVASYKIGALQFAAIGIPFLHTVLGREGLDAFIEGKGGIEVVVVTDTLSHTNSSQLHQSVRWPCEPSEGLPIVLGLDDQDEDEDEDMHTRKSSTLSSHSTLSTASTTSNSTNTTSSYSAPCSDLCRLNTHLRIELLDSALLSSAWRKNDVEHLQLHAPMQIVAFFSELQMSGGEMPLGHALGGSKPMCRVCAWYLVGARVYRGISPSSELINKQQGYASFLDTPSPPLQPPPSSSSSTTTTTATQHDADFDIDTEITQRVTLDGESHCSFEDEDEDDVDPEEVRWQHSRPSIKVRSDWLVPPSPALDPVALGALAEDVQSEMGRVVEEVAFDCYL